ncbi:MAG: hypothetical protein GVY33_10975 [Alphaproteobacteria bacterium]|nr:hypothetical protein [Alphaproteobacteria bacterium]
MSATLARERDGAASDRERLWTPAMPTSFFDGFGIGDVAAARVLWAVWSVPRRYRLAARAWRREARLATEIALRAKLRRLQAAGLLEVRAIEGPGLVFDGQHWCRTATHGRTRFLGLRLTDAGDAAVRRALAAVD